MGIRLVLAIGLSLIAGTSGVVAQDKAAPHESYQYDIANQQTVTGVVESVTEYQCPVSGTVGTHIVLKLTIGSIEVHLAPAKFVKDFEIAVNKGDQVEIRGAKIIFRGKPALIAKTLVIDRTTFTFRDNNGKPLW